jgi:hypothetical protein
MLRGFNKFRIQETAFLIKQRFCANSRKSGKSDRVLQKFCLNGPEILDQVFSSRSQRFCAGSRKSGHSVADHAESAVGLQEVKKAAFFIKQRFCANSNIWNSLSCHTEILLKDGMSTGKIRIRLEEKTRSIVVDDFFECITKKNNSFDGFDRNHSKVQTT